MAYDAAAARERTPSLSKMLLTWRCTVLSLTNSSVAIAWLVLPTATSLSTSISRALKGPGTSAGRSSSSARCRSGRAPRRTKLKLSGVFVADCPTG
jgi:hypothetical protein